MEGNILKQLTKLKDVINTRRLDIIAYSVFIGIFIVVRRDVLFNPELLTMIDQSILPRNPSFIPFVSAWLPENLGFFGITPSFGVLLWNFFSVISFGNQAIAQKLVIAHSLFACFAMYFFLGNHITKSRLSRIIGSIIFAYSPVAVHQWVTPVMWGYSLLPLVLNYSFNIFKKETTKYRDAILLALTSLFAISYLPHLTLLIPIIIFVFLLVYVLVEKNKMSYFLHCLKYFSIFAALYIALSWSFLVGIYSFFTSGALTTINFPASFFLYDNFTLSNALRLTGDPWRTFFFENNVIGFFLPLLAFLAIPLATHHEKRRKAIGFALLSIILLAFGLFVNYGFEWFKMLLNSFSIIAVLRDPMKILLILSLAYSVLIAVTTDGLVKRLRSSSILLRIENVTTKEIRSLRFSFANLKPIIFDAFIAALILLPYFAYVPIYDNNAFSAKGYDWAPEPTSYDMMIKWLDNHQNEGDFRYMLLPITPSGPTSRAASEYPNYFSAASGYANPNTLSYVISVFDDLTSNETFNLGNLVAPANVKYLMVPLDATSVGNDQGSLEGPPRRSETSLVGSPRSFFNILSSQEDLKLIYSENNLMVFENTKFIPHLFVSKNALYVIGDRDGQSALTSLPGFDICSAPLIFGEQYPNEDLLKVSSTQIFFNRDFDDLLLSYLVESNGVDLWTLGKSPPVESLEQSVIDGWQKPIGRYSSIYLNGGNFFSYGGDNSYIETTTKAAVDVLFNSTDSPTTELWLRVLYSPISQGTLSFHLDNVTLNTVIQPKSENFIGFKWVNLGSFSISEGTHTLTISNERGYTALDEFVAVPSNELEVLKPTIADSLKSTGLVFLYDVQSPFFEQETDIERTTIIKSDSTSWTTWSIPSSSPIPTIEIDTLDKMEGDSSIKWIINSTGGGERHLSYEFSIPQNWTNQDLLEFWMYGSGGPQAYAIQISDTAGSWRNLIYPNATHSGWKLLSLPLDEFVEQSQTPIDLSNVKKINIIFFPQTSNDDMDVLRFSNINLVKVLSSSVHGSIYLPNENYYSIAFNRPPDLNASSVIFKIDNNTIPFMQSEQNWLESERSYLNRGMHEISIELPAEAKITKIAVYTAPKLTDLFNSSSDTIEYSAQKISETEYKVQFYSKDPVFLVLGESYDPEWCAYVGGKELLHFPAFSLTNGFYTASNETQEIVIKFELQNIYLTFVSFRVSVLALSFIILLYSFTYEFVRARKRLASQSSRPEPLSKEGTEKSI